MSTYLIVFLSVPQYLLLNAVCCSLVNKSTAPGQKDWDSEKSVWTSITNLAKDISVSDPQFLLKVGMHVCVSWCVQGLCTVSGGIFICNPNWITAAEL